MARAEWDKEIGTYTTDDKDDYNLEIKISKEQYVIAQTEFSWRFVYYMFNRMCLSFFRYGRAEDAMTPQPNGPAKIIDALASANLRMEKYLQTGNVEYLVDAANFMMMEFMYPRVKGAFFKATDSHESPGRIESSSGEAVPYSNRDLL